MFGQHDQTCDGRGRTEGEQTETQRSGSRCD